MTINPSGPSSSRIEGTAAARSTPAVVRATDEKAAHQSEAPVAGQRDVLDLSPAALAFVARSSDEGALSAERMLELRQRVLDGAYNSLDALDGIAHAIRKSVDHR